MFTDFSKSFFGKSLNNLEYLDIENFFVDEKEESTRIEFKSFEPNNGDFNKGLENVYKAVCAFLNSEGGILIWGAPLGIKVEGKNEKIFKGNLSPSTELKEKDWLINKISDSITPLPIGINVAILKDGLNVLYVLEVQVSNYSPHQYKDRYYARLDGQSRPAPHYLIEALFRKITYPNIEGYIKIKTIEEDDNRYYVQLDVILFNFSELQNELNVSFSILCGQGVFTNEAPYSHRLNYNNFKEVLSFGEVETCPLNLVLDKKKLTDEFANEIDLVLSFVGRFSPIKSSAYKITIEESNPFEINAIFIESKENILYSELQRSLGETRESIIEKYVR